MKVFFAFPEIISTFVTTNQIFFDTECLILLRRAERLGSEKPWQPTRKLAVNGAKT